jgi:hypothetical protein
MSTKHNKSESPIVYLKNESSRQRWELFHKAIAHAKRSNTAALQETDLHASDSESSGPLLSIVR